MTTITGGGAPPVLCSGGMVPFGLS